MEQKSRDSDGWLSLSGLLVICGILLGLTAVGMYVRSLGYGVDVLGDGGVFALRYQLEDEDAYNRAMSVIRDRAESFEEVESVRFHRTEEGLLEARLSGLEEPDARERVREIMSRPARVRFRRVDDENAPEFFRRLSDAMPTSNFKLRRLGNGDLAITHAELSALRSFFDGRVDEDHVVGFQFEAVRDRSGEEDRIDPEKSYWRTFYLHERAVLTGERIDSVAVEVDEKTNEPVLVIELDDEGAETFTEFTANHVGTRFAIMVDDEIESAPVIREKIPGGTVQLSMGALQPYRQKMQEARDLMILLRGGAHPSAVEFVGSEYLSGAQSDG